MMPRELTTTSGARALLAANPPSVVPHPHSRRSSRGTHRGMTILDGQGGTLALDLARPELRLLGDACERLLTGELPSGASVIKVRCGERCYILSRQSAQTDDAVLSIANLFDPGERVALGPDFARIVVRLLVACP